MYQGLRRLFLFFRPNVPTGSPLLLRSVTRLASCSACLNRVEGNQTGPGTGSTASTTCSDFWPSSLPSCSSPALRFRLSCAICTCAPRYSHARMQARTHARTRIHTHMRTNAHTQDYRWWWRSMFTGGSAAIYMFAYACFHYFSRAHPTAKFDLLASSIYFGTPSSVRTSQHV